jgi:hypothetical protein
MTTGSNGVSPLAGWVIAQCHGLTLIGKRARPLMRVPSESAGILSPVYRLEPQLVALPGGSQSRIIHIITPLWLLIIDEVELPVGVLVVSCDVLSRAEQEALALRMTETRTMLEQMRANAAGQPQSKVVLPSEKRG